MLGHMQHAHRPKSRPILALILTLAMLLLAACSGPASQSGDSGSSTPAGGDSGESAAQETREPIVIGAVLPFTAPGDVAGGTQARQGMEMAIQEINAAGGVLGRELKLAVGDSQGKPEVGVAAVERLISKDKVTAVVGAWHSPVSVAITDALHRAGIPNIQAASWADDITAKHYPEIFRIAQYSSQLARDVIVPYLTSGGYKKVGIMVEMSDFGVSVADPVEQLIKDGGYAIEVHRETFDVGAVDMTPQLISMKNWGPDIVLLAGSSAPSIYSVVKQAWDAGLAPGAKLLGSWDFPALPEYWETNGDKGVGIIYPSFEHPKVQVLTEKGRKAAEAFKAAYGHEPSYYSLLHYDAVYILADAITRAGSTDAKAIISALEETVYGGSVGTITFTNEETGPVYHQWIGHTAFMVQLTAVNQPHSEGTVVWPESVATGPLVWPPSQ